MQGSAGRAPQPSSLVILRTPANTCSQRSQRIPCTCVVGFRSLSLCVLFPLPVHCLKPCTVSQQRPDLGGIRPLHRRYIQRQWRALVWREAVLRTTATAAVAAADPTSAAGTSPAAASAAAAESSAVRKRHQAGKNTHDLLYVLQSRGFSPLLVPHMRSVRVLSCAGRAASQACSHSSTALPFPDLPLPLRTAFPCHCHCFESLPSRCYEKCCVQHCAQIKAAGCPKCAP